MQGLVLSGSKNFFSVDGDDGRVRLCSIKGKKIKHSKRYYNPLAPGDFVCIEPDVLDPNRGQIVELLPRKNHFIRLNQKMRTMQILAANIDVLICVVCAHHPPFRPRFADRVLVQAESENIPVIILVNKIDLGTTKQVEDRLKNWASLGYEIMRVSARQGTGIQSCAMRLHGLRTAIIGQSGVGKSSILNAFDPSIQLKTAAVSQKYNRGIHTTTQGLLLKMVCPSAKFIIIDTPGIRSFSPAGIHPENLILYFPEMKPLAGKCLFGLSCTHTHEKGCAVLNAYQHGRIHPDRYESWKNIFHEITTQQAGNYS